MDRSIRSARLALAASKPASETALGLPPIGISAVFALIFALALAGSARAAEEIQCGVLAPVVDRACDVTAGTDGQILLQGDVLADGQIYRGGSVLVDTTGDISCSGCGCSAPDATVIRCPESVISPGLINAYDHITFSQNAPAIDTGERYEQRHDWRAGARGHAPLASVPGGATTNQIRWAELRQLMSGTTAVSSSGGAAGLVRNLDSAANQGLGIPTHRRDTFPLGDSSGTQLATGCAYPNIRTSASIASDAGYLPVIAEGIDDVAHNEFLCTSSAAAGGQDLLQPQTAIGKGLGYETQDFQTIQWNGAGLIWSPRSNLRLYGDTLRVTAAGPIEIAIGTDWTATGSMNMLRELSCVDSWNHAYLADHFSQEEIWRMATKTAASLTATSSEIGTLAPGRVADLAIFDATIRSDYDAILNAQPDDVILVMRAGKVLFGEEQTVNDVPNVGSCDTLDVCGSDRAACLSSEIGVTLAALQAGAGSVYPLFFCGTPVEEPTCSPQRSSSVNGSTTYDGLTTPGDLDGDGLVNAGDNCPSVFNPVRPLDDGAQPDYDLDGLGDECDPTPVPEPGVAGGLLGIGCIVTVGVAGRRFGRVA